MIIASATQCTGRASQWYETVTSSHLHPNETGAIMVDLLPNTSAGWQHFSNIFLEAFTSSTETLNLRDQLKHLIWQPDKESVKQHIQKMNIIFHNMTSLKDPLTDRDKTMYFMESLVNKPYLVKKVNLTGTFNKACRDSIHHTSKEKLQETIIKQRCHIHPSNVKVNNILGVFKINNAKSKDFDFDSN
jgi:hypothetical protein